MPFTTVLKQYPLRTLTLMSVLAILPNLLGMVNVSIPGGGHFHFFQLAIFLAAARYGVWGGVISGGFGSLLSASQMHNPWLIIGNMILGGVTGYLVERQWSLPLAALAGFAVQLPWLWFSDFVLMHLPSAFLLKLSASLFLSNLVWVFLVNWGNKTVDALWK